MVLHGLSFPVEGIVLGALKGRLQSSLLDAAQSRSGRSEGTCGEHGEWKVSCRGEVGCGAMCRRSNAAVKSNLLVGTEQC